MPAFNHIGADENEVLQKIALGDTFAFKQMFDCYWDPLYQYLKGIVKAPEIAEEIASDVFIKIWENREKATQIRNLDGFLFRIAHNKAMDFFKFSAKNKKIQSFVEEVIALNAKNTSTADYAILEAEYQDVLDEAISHLSPQRNLIFKLSRVEGLSNEEIAKKLNLSHSTVKNTINDSLRIVSNFLKKKNVPNLIILLILLGK